MMIVELIDQDDYIEWMQNLGVPVTADYSPEQCSQQALAWLPTQDTATVQEFTQALAALQEQTPVMLPEVADALALLVKG